MNSDCFESTNQIRLQFTQAMSEMYQLEVPMYKKLLSLANKVNQESIKKSDSVALYEKHLLELEHHGAIRVGHVSELSTIRRLFKVMGMHPVDYYDLSIAGIPVHSTAFRALEKDDLNICPFRVFCSLLRLDLIEDKQLHEQANKILNKRQIFPEELLKLIDISEKQGGLTPKEAIAFVENALEVFRWHQDATVAKTTYAELQAAHGLIAVIVSFKGPHINHLTPKILNIDNCQEQFSHHDIKAKAVVEGPPKRKCPILLRQTSFIAIAEDVIFTDGQAGTHTARFGEVEQRGIALTPKGRALYDQLLTQVRNGDAEINYSQRLQDAFEAFPDSYTEIRKQALGYFCYSPNEIKISSDLNQLNEVISLEALITEGFIDISPILYEDFLPVSAAGIFTSNLSVEATEVNQANDLEAEFTVATNTNRNAFEDALGSEVIDSFSLYEGVQQESLNNCSIILGFDIKGVG